MKNRSLIINSIEDGGFQAILDNSDKGVFIAFKPYYGTVPEVVDWVLKGFFKHGARTIKINTSGKGQEVVNGVREKLADVVKDDMNDLVKTFVVREW